MTDPPLPQPTGVRLAELLAVLSLGADLGMGQPMEHAMRQYLIRQASRPAAQPGAGRAGEPVLCSLIAWVGCHIDAYEQANDMVPAWRTRVTPGSATWRGRRR